MAKAGRYGKTTTTLQWMIVLIAHNRSCAQCGSKEDIQMDHIIAIANGGGNTIENIQPLCETHNKSKGAHHSTDYRKTFTAYFTLYGSDERQMIYTNNNTPEMGEKE